MTSDDDMPESQESLFMLAAAPLAWAAHFLLSYCTSAIYCAKLASPDASVAPLRVAIASYTAVALAVVVSLGVRGHRRHRTRGDATSGHDDDSPIGRHRFLGFATLLLSALAALAIAYAGLVFVLVRSCR